MASLAREIYIRPWTIGLITTSDVSCFHHVTSCSTRHFHRSTVTVQSSESGRRRRPRVTKHEKSEASKISGNDSNFKRIPVKGEGGEEDPSKTGRPPPPSSQSVFEALGASSAEIESFMKNRSNKVSINNCESKNTENSQTLSQDDKQQHITKPSLHAAEAKKNHPDLSGSKTFNEEKEDPWKNAFPAYMQSKENFVQSGDSSGAQNHKESKNGKVNGTLNVSKTFLEWGEKGSGSFLPGKCVGDVFAEERRMRGKKLEEVDPVWAAIRAEAKLDAEREPLLSSFLYASILAHGCFERSLGFVLANRLENATLLATQLLDIFDDVLAHDSLRTAIREDVQAVKDRDPSCRSYSSALLYYKGYHAIQSYRISHALWNRGQTVLALALQSRISEVFAVDIHPAARIGSGILLDHGTGVVIGETAVVGDKVSLLQGVTLGGTGKEAGDRHPKIHGGVLIGAGATVLGNISVGRGAMIAAGSLVLKNVPSHSMVAGTPAKIVGMLEELAPSLTMKHDVTRDFCELWDEAVRTQIPEEHTEGGGI